MKIAFISYEYPPDTAYGGIATYVYQAARMLQQNGHHVEVFTGSDSRKGTIIEDGVIVHRLLESDHNKFIELVGKVFAQRHHEVKFDILEGPDCLAEARTAISEVPDIPLVVKLHTSSILLLKLNYYETSWRKKIWFWLISLRYRQKPVWGYNPKFYQVYKTFCHNDVIEKAHAFQADEIVSPSQDLGKKMIQEWHLPTELVNYIPYPYIPSLALLEIPIQTQTNRVTFIGRLEIRKGVIDLAQAIPLILKKYPQVKFRLVGNSEDSPIPHMDMQVYLEKMLQPYLTQIEFTGNVSPNEIPHLLAETDICVFPSLWENFPCVCLEAMSAGRGIVGSQAGGMLDMLDGGKVGKLVPPREPIKIAEAVIELLADPTKRMELGEMARHRILTVYNQANICQMQEASYQRAIARRQSLGPRKLSL
jgi:glycosyltransferase involved in cell wall biosynthesis